MELTRQRILRFAVGTALAGPVYLATGCPNNKQKPSPPVVNPAVPVNPQWAAAQKKAGAERKRIAALQRAAHTSLARVREGFDKVLFRHMDSNRKAFSIALELKQELDAVEGVQVEMTADGNRVLSARLVVLETKFREAFQKHGRLGVQSPELLSAANELAKAHAALSPGPVKGK
ncbi:MAG: hypothetical protein JKY65_29165 [Planctomycetes bacterium]|nr:hypothetical protein [Planctomycetota bacterium]